MKKILKIISLKLGLIKLYFLLIIKFYPIPVLRLATEMSIFTKLLKHFLKSNFTR